MRWFVFKVFVAQDVPVLALLKHVQLALDVLRTVTRLLGKQLPDVKPSIELRSILPTTLTQRKMRSVDTSCTDPQRDIGLSPDPP